MSRSLLGACVGLLALTACTKQDVPSASIVAASSMPAAADRTVDSRMAPSEPVAESGLSIKRGLVVVGSQQTTFQPCGERVPLWVVDQTEDVLRQAFSGVTAPIELYLEAYGERTSIPERDEAARVYSGAFILEEVLYAAPVGETGGCAEEAPTHIVGARGNEPFWAADVMEGRMVWRQPEPPKEIVFEALQSQDSEGTVGYSGSASGHTLELLIDAQACRDSMSGAYFAYSARAVFDGKELKGCARIAQ